METVAFGSKLMINKKILERFGIPNGADHLIPIYRGKGYYGSDIACVVPASDVCPNDQIYWYPEDVLLQLEELREVFIPITFEGKNYQLDFCRAQIEGLVKEVTGC